MSRTKFRTILHWVESILHLAIPVAAGLALIYEVFAGKQIDTDALLRLVLALVAGIAISRTLERYVTLRNIEGQTRKLSEISNVELLRSARECGVVDLFRRANIERVTHIVEAIKSARGTLDICGVALPTMVENDSFREAIVEYSEKYDVRALLLKPDSDEATRRKNIEAPLGRKTIADIEATRDWLMTQQERNKRFRVHLYDLPPMLSLVITDQFAFVEPYHFGRPDGLQGCIGGHVPMMKIRNLPELGPKNPYGFFKAHFEYLWNFTRGLRVNLTITIIEAKPSSYVVMENQTDKDIQMNGWELTGQASHRPYQFEPDFVWKHGERIVITQELGDYPDVYRVFQAEGDFLGNNAILRLTSDPGTLVAEWSIPLSANGNTASLIET